MSSLRVFAFSPAFGLPTSGPFALKLMTWLRFAGLDFDVVYEDDTRKAPKGKNPWIEIDGEVMGDTELIIERLAVEHDIDLDAHLSARQRAIATAVRRMVEDHLHQVLEWELFVHEDGWRFMANMIDESLPWGLRAIVKKSMRGHFAKQLHARGVARHNPEQIAAMGKSDLDAIEALLGESTYLFGEEPCLADASVFGLVAPLVFAPIDAPVMQYARTLPKTREYCERLLATWFPGEMKAAA